MEKLRIAKVATLEEAKVYEKLLGGKNGIIKTYLKGRIHA